MAFANKRSVMTLYSASDVESHRARIVLAEKGVPIDLIEVDRYGGQRLEDLRDLNPYQIVPTLLDRDLVLYQSKIIMEYLDERFPHPPLLPVYPVMRAQSRLMMFRIENDLYPLMHTIQNGTESAANKARKELQASLVKIASMFNDYPYFLNEEFSLVDCSLAPLLWRLPAVGVELPKQAAPILNYAKRLFKRDSFRKSLTETEAELRDDLKGL
jgi:RNA polymerase-associated protein